MSNAKDATVKVTVLPEANPPFRLQSSLMQGGELVFHNDHHPGFYVHFTIDDPDSNGYRFPKNEKKALAAKKWDGVGDPCPAQGETWDEFYAESVSSDFKTLKVRNPNGSKAKFGYSLFVTQTPETGGQFLTLDPIGDNRNGPIAMDSLSWGATAIGGALVGAA